MHCLLLRNMQLRLFIGDPQIWAGACLFGVMG